MSQRQLDLLDAADFASVIETETGARTLASVLAMCKVLESSYYPGVTDMAEVAFREGQRSIGLFLLARADGREQARLRIAGEKRIEVFEQEDDYEKEGD